MPLTEYYQEPSEQQTNQPPLEETELVQLATTPTSETQTPNTAADAGRFFIDTAKNRIVRATAAIALAGLPVGVATGCAANQATPGSSHANSRAVACAGIKTVKTHKGDTFVTLTKKKTQLIDPLTKGQIVSIAEAEARNSPEEHVEVDIPYYLDISHATKKLPAGISVHLFRFCVAGRSDQERYPTQDY